MKKVRGMERTEEGKKKKEERREGNVRREIYSALNKLSISNMCNFRER